MFSQCGAGQFDAAKFLIGFKSNDTRLGVKGPLCYRISCATFSKKCATLCTDMSWIKVCEQKSKRKMFLFS